MVSLDNLNSPEVRKRAKYDPEIKKQIHKIRLEHLDNYNLRNYLKLFYFYHKKLMDAFKRKESQKLLSLMTDLLEWAYGTRETWVLIELILLFAVVLENLQDYDMAAFLYNQVRIIANYSKRALDIYKVKAYLGLAEVCIQLSKFENAIKLLKKCL